MMTNTNTLTVTQGDLTMNCRLFQRTRYNSWILSGYIGHECRMECDVTVAVRKYSGERLRRELIATAECRLKQIAQE